MPKCSNPVDALIQGAKRAASNMRYVQTAMAYADAAEGALSRHFGPDQARIAAMSYVCKEAVTSKVAACNRMQAKEDFILTASHTFDAMATLIDMKKK